VIIIALDECYLLLCNAVQSVESLPTFRRNISPQICLPPALTLVSCSAYSSTLKMEAICFSVTLVDFQRNTRRCIPEDIILHNHHCENLKPYIIALYCQVSPLPGMVCFSGHKSPAEEALPGVGASWVLSSRLSRSPAGSAACHQRPARCHLQR
jgi:hypothetical protein